ncbi:MAG TPA: class I SAM-dependent methyltransferase [Bryobacteraceae bacterium]|nr:class I SAM-dependent methyltransferase [Bryobacteraceae bacterium]
MYRRVNSVFSQARDSRLSSREVFTEIYSKNMWGKHQSHPHRDFPFYSGPGSDDAAASPYVDCINRFIESEKVRSIVDLGCGDFRVGSRIVSSSFHYVGIDIVEPLIEANRARFANNHVQFRTLDIITDELPVADLCLIREVLQHLSNAQIIRVLAKLKQFKWVIVTEDHPGPVGSFMANRDKPHGKEARVVWGSGIVLSAPPFNVPDVELMLEVPAMRPEHPEGECIRSFLVRN